MTSLALVVYAVALACSAVVVWRRPVVALYVFVVGLALHNAVADALYGAGIRGHALTAIQAWKDVLLLVALASVGFDALRKRRLPFRPLVVDWLALAFAAIVVLYALDPAGRPRRARDAQGDGVRAPSRPRRRGRVLPRARRRPAARQRALARPRARGRASPRGASSTPTRSTSTGGATTAPSTTSTKQLGYPYGPGLSHLPENFVYNNGNEQELTRRLVSTFLSPLGAAYLCVVGAAARAAHGAPLFCSSCPPRRDSSGRTRAPPSSRLAVGLDRARRRVPARVAARRRGRDARRRLRRHLHVPGHRAAGALHAARARVPARERAASRAHGARAVDGVASERAARRDQHRPPPPAGLRPRQRGRGRVPRARAAQGGRVQLHRARRGDRPPRRAALHRVEPRIAGRARSPTRRARSPRRSRPCCSSRSRPTLTASRGLHTASGGWAAGLDERA